MRLLKVMLLVAIITSFGLLYGCDLSGSGLKIKVPLVVELTVSKVEGLCVTLKAQVTGGLPRTTPPDYQIGWDFDYDQVQFDIEASGQVVTKCYSAPGEYLVGCQVTDAYPQTKTETIKIEVGEKEESLPNVVISWADNDAADLDPYVMNFVADVSGGVPRSTVPNYAIDWDFSYTAPTFDSEAAGATVSKRYTTGGVYTVACRVRDARPNKEVIKTMIVRVPSLFINISCTNEPVGSRTFKCIANYGGGTPMAGSTPYEVGWDFDYHHPNATIDAAGKASGQPIYKAYSAPGRYSIYAHVIDATTTKRIDIQVVQVP